MARLFNALRLALLVAGLFWSEPSFSQNSAPPQGATSGRAKAADVSTQKFDSVNPATKKTDPANQQATAEKAPGATPASAAPAPKAANSAEPASKDGTASAQGTQPAAKATTGTTAESAPVDGSTYVVRMRDLAQRIDELKEQIRRSHTRLSLLSETILSGGVGGARAEISFTNDMSSAFRLVRALFVLDGAVQYNKQDETGGLSEQKSIPIFNGSIPPGDHTLQILVKLQGHGYGVFSYLRGYKFEVKSTQSFTVTEGKTLRLEAIAFEKGGVTTPLEQRPAIRYAQKVLNEAGPSPKPEPAPAGPGGAKVKAGVSVGSGGQ
jgi:hypothetical protein